MRAAARGETANASNGLQSPSRSSGTGLSANWRSLLLRALLLLALLLPRALLLLALLLLLLSRGAVEMDEATSRGRCEVSRDAG
jgi:hypothetical protein